MFSFLSKLLGGKAHRRLSRCQACPQVETLEDRAVPATLHSSIDSLGYLNINGTSEGDQVTVTYDNNTCTVRGLTIHAGYNEVWTEQKFKMTDLFKKQINFHGFAGNDSFSFSPLPLASNATHLRVVAYGGAGDDTLKGGNLDDLLIGGSGNDKLYGGRGNDSMTGDDGNDILYGEAGNDILMGGLGFDKLYGGADNDILDGGTDGIADYLEGGPGADKFWGEWVQDNNSYYIWYKNIDAPVDFVPSNGDTIDSPFPMLVYTATSR